LVERWTSSRKNAENTRKAEVLARLRAFAERSKWKKARISRELGVSLSTVERWLNGHDTILVASMLAIRRFLRERE
jgi:transcriptional regulator with XRE-family HTH domain